MGLATASDPNQDGICMKRAYSYSTKSRTCIRKSNRITTDARLAYVNQSPGLGTAKVNRKRVSSGFFLFVGTTPKGKPSLMTNRARYG